jgi:hypothetical protein
VVITEFDYVTDLGLQWPEGRSLRKETTTIIIHHTVGFYGTPTRFRALHQSRVNSSTHRGVSYNYLVLKTGEIYVGRGLEYEGGSVRNDLTNNLNSRAVAIAFDGDMRDAALPTPEQLASALRLTQDILDYYNLPISAVVGHNEVITIEGKTYPTLCPCIDMKAFRSALLPFPADFAYGGDTYVNVRTAPVDGQKIGILNKDELCIVLDIKDGWAEILKSNGNGSYLRGYCLASWLVRK